VADRDTASWPDWYLAGALRGIADLVRQGVDDGLLLRAWDGYVAGAVAAPFEEAAAPVRSTASRFTYIRPPGL
jgi:hypothetical protein